MNANKTKNAFILNFFKLYNMLWGVCLPLLKRNKRLKQGFDRRIHTSHLNRADIWIQAASAGEAYLAVRLVQQLVVSKPTLVLVTSITAQGMDILKKNLVNHTYDPNIKLTIEWFIFDRPAIVKKAVSAVSPKIMVLLETELWPALLFYLKNKSARIFIVNARLSQKSFHVYMKTRFIWKYLAPDYILATSDTDKKRYIKMFANARVDTMPNIKFETLAPDETAPRVSSGAKGRKHLKDILPDQLPLTVMASIRKKEERLVAGMIKNLMISYPDQVVAVFPRHMDRLKAWQTHFKRLSLGFLLRSELKQPVNQPGIILWDAFGELKTVYGSARIVFVGGSLKPYGGQNFIEPVLEGAATVIGPYYDDFIWAQQLINARLVATHDGSEDVCQAILSELNQPGSRHARIDSVRKLIKNHLGGARLVCHKITENL
jgi:3-deoxy-D-manno-octulosonic-acid transferase